MAKGMIILGSPGAGKTTLGAFVASKLGVAFLDIDDYIWRKDTAIPYTVMYSRQEKIGRLMEAAEAAGEFVMAGSMSSFHEFFDPLFLLAVYLTADENLRMDRVYRRAIAAFGKRVLPGGDMYEVNVNFLNGVAGYDHGAPSNHSEQHREWIRQLTCPVLKLDGGDTLESNAETIIDAYRKQAAINI